MMRENRLDRVNLLVLTSKLRLDYHPIAGHQDIKRRLQRKRQLIKRIDCPDSGDLSFERRLPRQSIKLLIMRIAR